MSLATIDRQIPTLRQRIHAERGAREEVSGERPPRYRVVTIRVPRVLHERLRAASHAAGLSMNRAAVQALEHLVDLLLPPSAVPPPEETEHAA